MLSEKDTQAVHGILVRQLDLAPAQLTPEASITGDLGADSLDVIEITMAIEEHFNLTFPDEQLDAVQTISDLCEAIARLLEPDRPV